MKKIIERIFGKKYYAVIILTRGIEKYEIASEIHSTPESAQEHCKRIATTLSFEAVEVVSFRSRNGYSLIKPSA